MHGNVTIDRGSDNLIRIRIRDDASGIEFVEVKLSLEAYAKAITGLAEVRGEISVRGLEYVGKHRVTETRLIKCPLKTYKKEELEEWLASNAQEDGWLLNTYLGSQSSVKHDPDGTILRYSVTKYVEEKP